MNLDVVLLDGNKRVGHKSQRAGRLRHSLFTRHKMLVILDIVFLCTSL
jgi:hypothetical protein